MCRERESYAGSATIPTPLGKMLAYSDMHLAALSNACAMHQLGCAYRRSGVHIVYEANTPAHSGGPATAAARMQ
eukprot:scaffold273029_cov17-Tisochrysis_lutea.AAC.1